jgi:hypothetical protein
VWFLAGGGLLPGDGQEELGENLIEEVERGTFARATSMLAATSCREEKRQVLSIWSAPIGCRRKRIDANSESSEPSIFWRKTGRVLLEDGRVSERNVLRDRRTVAKERIRFRSS